MLGAVARQQGLLPGISAHLAVLPCEAKNDMVWGLGSIVWGSWVGKYRFAANRSRESKSLVVNETKNCLGSELRDQTQ